MFKTWLCVLLFCCARTVYAQDGIGEWQSLFIDDEQEMYRVADYEELSELAAHPFNINAITRDQLLRLPFLSETLIENIEYYVYKYAPLLSLHELSAVEGMDRQTLKYLCHFLYIGEHTQTSSSLPSLKELLRKSIRHWWIRADIPFNAKAGYADGAKRRYVGTPYYTNTRFRLNYKDRVSMGFQAEKDAGEAFFSANNKVGFDSYAGYLFFRDFGKWETVAVGQYKATFGQGLVMNSDFYSGKYRLFSGIERLGRGFRPNTSMYEDGYLQGLAGTYRLHERWKVSAFASYRCRDAVVDSMFITRLKTDGLHRTDKEITQENTIGNTLIGADLSYRNKYFECGLTAVYNVFNKPLKTPFRLYNEHAPRGHAFGNIGFHYKAHIRKGVFSGEVAVNEKGQMAWMNVFSYQPNVDNIIKVINRYYSPAYTALCARSFGENTAVQNEYGLCISLENKSINKLKCQAYADVFYFPERRYRVSKDKTWGADINIVINYMLSETWQFWLKYGIKNKARDYITSDKEKHVLPHIRQRTYLRAVYAPSPAWQWKATLQYVSATDYGRKRTSGFSMALESVMKPSNFPLKLQLLCAAFRTDDYDARISLYEPSLLYMFGHRMYSGRGWRTVGLLHWDIGRSVSLQAQYAWTHYFDRNVIGSGMEEIQGADKSDLRLQLRLRF